MIIKIKILSKCSYRDGKAYLPVRETVDTKGKRYMRNFPCPKCNGSGLSGTWINLTEFQQLLENADCQHENVTSNGGYHFSAGEVWDDIEEVCSDCGQVLD